MTRTVKQEAPEPQAVATPLDAPVMRKPFSVRIGATCHEAFNQAAYLARQGYIFSDGPIQVFPNGMAFFDMHLGTPVDYLVERAKETVRIGAEQEEADRQRAIKEEARRIVEEEKQAAAAKQIAALKAENARKIAQIQAEADAAIAALSK
ncbi:hypothetical protein [Massilia sp. IC2-476]|uniref:hypothetical protein n=1 Tax=Massilia sp. IC2-476 TaxID=2887199 RepID=UPI001D0FFFE7|nr:hypothetical protein [Massilia sp. IC2-476]MCC2971072.1 hypothetical protein [Massilia sp. IC2-476]